MTYVTVGELALITDEHSAELVTDRTSDTAAAIRVLPMKDPDGSPLDVTDAMVDGDAGWANIKANNTTGYVWHLSTDSGFAGDGLIGLGADTSNAVALIVSVKANTARGIVITNESTIGSGYAARGLEVNQRSTTSPVAYFSPRVANVAPTFRLSSGGITGAASTVRDVLADHTSGESGATKFWEIRLDGQHNFYRPVAFGGVADTEVNRTNGIVIDYASSESLIRFYRRASSTPGAETWYPHRIHTSTTELVFSSAATTATHDGSETMIPIIRMRAEGGVPRIGFFGAAPAVQGIAYTQTYSSTSRTSTALSAAAVVTTTPTTGAYGYTLAQATAVLTNLNALRDDQIRDRQLINALIDDLQALGLTL